MDDAFVGMNLTEVQKSAKDFDRAAGTLRSVGQAMDRALPQLPWVGRSVELFKVDWTANRKLLVDGAQALSELTKAMMRNWQEQADQSSEGRAPATQRTEKLTFGSDRNAGLIVRLGERDGYSDTTSAGGRTVRTYKSEGYARVDTGDLARVVSFISAVKGKKVQDSPVDVGVSVTASKGTEYKWTSDGSDASKLHGTDDIPGRMVQKRDLDGYGSDDVNKDIANGKLAQPSSVTSVSGVEAKVSIDVKAGQWMFGRSGEVKVSREVESFAADGSTSDRYIITGKVDESAGQSVGAATFPAGLGLKAVSGSEGSLTVETQRDAAGNVTHIVLTTSSRVTSGGEASLSFAGGGANLSAYSGMQVERTLDFDVNDPAVAQLLKDHSVASLVAHPGMASESVAVYDVSGSGEGSNAILYAFSADSGSERSIVELSRNANSDTWWSE